MIVDFKTFTFIEDGKLAKVRIGDYGSEEQELECEYKPEI